MVDPVTIVINATLISALYALVAIGFTLVFGVGGVLNFAHGALITVGAYGAHAAVNVYGYSMWVGIFAGAVAAAVVGAILYTGLVQFIEDQLVTVLLVTLVAGFIIQHAISDVYQSQITLPQLFDGSVGAFGYSAQANMVFVFVSSWIIIAALVAFINYTRRGKAILALSMSKRGASLVGIDRQQISLLTWAIAGGFAGFAGVMLTTFQTGGAQMGLEPLVLSFAIVVLGGLGSIKGSVVGAYVIGFIETITVSVVSPDLTGLSALVVLVAVLLVRPSGLYGREVPS
jgi:branched-chain amino acid transport system permease protein